MGRNPKKSGGKTGRNPRDDEKVAGDGGSLFASTGEMARILGITPVWLRTLARTGEVPKPVKTNPRSIWDVAKTVQGHIATIKRGQGNAEESSASSQKAADLALTIARQRKTEIEAQAAAKELLELEGRLVDVHEVAATWADICSVTRTRILTAPAKLAPRIVGLRNAAEIEAAIRGELSDALAELARQDVDFVSADAAVPEPQSRGKGGSRKLPAAAETHD